MRHGFGLAGHLLNAFNAETIRKKCKLIKIDSNTIMGTFAHPVTIRVK